MDGLREYRVSLRENQSDFSIVFYCWADDEDHAMEQAENAYPDCDILIVNRTYEDDSIAS